MNFDKTLLTIAHVLVDLVTFQELKEAPHQARAFVDSVPEFVSPSLSGLVDLSSIDAILLSNYT